MAEKTNSHSWFGRLKGSTAELNERLAEDAKQREAEGKRKGSIILNANDILTGNWDASKVLFTTLGGKARPITAEDLKKFKQNIKTAQSKFTKGITAQQVIDWSTGVIDVGTKHAKSEIKSDLDRAKSEIKMAVPVGAMKGRVRFITNAGPDSKVFRHQVIVEFMNYSAEAASGAIDPRKSALRLRKGPLKIECDCERWRYWFRYIATIGGYNAGRAETGFPKIKNPKLQNIACKHIVRVMSEVNSGGSTLTYLINLMKKAKSSDTLHAELRQTQKNAGKLLQNQAKRTSGHDIKTSKEKSAARKSKQKLAEEIIKTRKPHAKPKPRSKTKTENVAELMVREGVPRTAVEAMFIMRGVSLSRGTTKEAFLKAFDEAVARK